MTKHEMEYATKARSLTAASEVSVNLDPTTGNDSILRTRRRGQALTSYSVDKPSSIRDMSGIWVRSDEVEDRVGDSLVDRVRRAAGKKPSIMTGIEEQDDLFDADNDNSSLTDDLIRSDVQEIKMDAVTTLDIHSDLSNHERMDDLASKIREMVASVRDNHGLEARSFVDASVGADRAVSKAPPLSAFCCPEKVTNNNIRASSSRSIILTKDDDGFEERSFVSSRVGTFCAVPKVPTPSPLARTSARHCRPETKIDTRPHNLVSFFQWNRHEVNSQDRQNLDSYLDKRKYKH